MLDKQGKLFGKISIVDILVVLIIAVVVVGAVFSFQKINNNIILTENKGLIKNSATETLEITFCIKNVRDITTEAIQPGDDVFMADTGKFLGQVVSVAKEPHKRLIYDNRGRALMATAPERYDATVVVSVPGKRLDGGFFTADNIHLVLDSHITIKTPTIQTTPTIQEIKTVTSE